MVGGGGSAEDGSGEHNMVVGSSKSHVRQHSVLPGTAVSTQQQRRTQSRRGIRAKHPLPFLFKSDMYMCVFFFIILFVMRKCEYAADIHPRRPPPPLQPTAPNAARLSAVAANAGLALRRPAAGAGDLQTACGSGLRLATCDLRHPRHAPPPARTASRRSSGYFPVRVAGGRIH